MLVTLDNIKAGLKVRFIDSSIYAGLVGIIVPWSYFGEAAQEMIKDWGTINDCVFKSSSSKDYLFVRVDYDTDNGPQYSLAHISPTTELEIISGLGFGPLNNLQKAGIQAALDKLNNITKQ